jgi:hypothetical protein
MQQRIETAPIAVDEIDLAGIGQALTRQWRLVGVFTALGLIAAALYLHVATYRYLVTLQVTPAAIHSTGLSGQLGNLASLAGVSLPTNADDTPFELYVLSLTSRQTADLLVHDDELLHALFAKEWDARETRWREPHGVTTALRKLTSVILGGPFIPWRPPDGDRLQKRLLKEVRVDRKKTSPVVTITVATPTPELGRMLLWKIHSQSDDTLRQRTLKRTSEYIVYLQDKLRTMDVADYRKALFDIVSEQEKARMMASSTLPFAADPLGGPTASAEPVEPNAWMVIGAGILGGAVVGALAGMMRQSRLAAKG